MNTTHPGSALATQEASSSPKGIASGHSVPGLSGMGIGTSSQVLTLCLIIGLGLALRLWRIDAASFWSDELFSVFWVRNPAWFLWTEGLELETTPPLYYALLQPWAAAFGDSELAIRGFSALLSTLTIPLVYLLGLRFLAPRGALLAAALFALMPMQVHYAQEARAYALLPLLVAMALHSLLGFLNAAERRAAPANRQWPWLAAYGLLAVLLVYTHATAAFILAAFGLCAAADLLVRRGANWPALWRFAAVNLVAVLLSLPQIRVMLVQSDRFDMQWVERPHLVGLLNAAASFLVDPTTPLSLFRLSCLFAAAVAGLFALLVWRARPRPLARLFLLGAPALFLASTILLSYASPFFMPRITVWIGVPFCILAAMALVAPVARWQRAAFALALLLAWGLGLQGVYARSPAAKEDWRGVAAVIAPQRGTADLIAIGPNTNLRGLAFYLGTEVQQSRWRPATATPWRLLFLPEGVPAPEIIGSEALAGAVAEGRPVWLVLKRGDWLNWGEMALTVAARPPEVDQSHAMLTLLHWPGSPMPGRDTAR